MRIMYIDQSDKVSGAQIVLMRLIANLPQKVHTIGLCPPDSKTSEAFGRIMDEVNGIDLPSPPSGRSPLAWIRYLARAVLTGFRIAALARRKEADITHANSFKAALLCIIPSLLSGRPLIWHMHDIPRPTRVNRWAAQSAGRVAHRILAVSKATREGLIALGVSPVKIQVIYNGIDAGELKHQADCGIGKSSALPKNGDGCLVTMVGAMTEWKGQDVLVQAAQRYLKHRNGTRFLLVGGPIEERDEGFKRYVTNLIKSSDARDSISMLGHRDDALAIIDSSDLIVHCSRRPDPLPTVILEAMTMGKPVIASRIGGVPEMVDDGVTGYTFTPENDAELADRIERLVRDPQRRQRLGRQGRQKVQTDFTMKGNVERIMNTYEGLTAS